MSNDILNRIISAPEGLTLCWLGNLSWLIHAQDRLVAFDLDLDLGIRLQPSPIAAEEIAPVLDVLFVTHEHGDHFNSVTAGTLVEQSDCLFVVPASCLAKAHTLGIPEGRLRVARPRQPFELLGMDVEPLRALHGDRHQAVYRHANLDDCGYLLTLGGMRLFQPGDSVLLQDHLELTDVDVLFVSPTDHNMYIEDAARLIQTLDPAHVFPQHFGTYTQTEDNLFWTRGYPDELRAALPARLQARFHKLTQGDVFTIPQA